MRPFAACVMLLLLTVAATAQPIFTADFEAATDGVPDGWRFSADRGECAGAWDEAEPPPTGHSIRLEVPEDATARATWSYADRIPADPDTCYRLSFKVMIATPGGAGGYVIIYENGEPAPSHWHMTGRMGGIQDWHDVAITFRTRPDCEWLQLQCKLWHAVGHCWYDDVVIEQIPEDELEVKPSPANYLPEDDGSPLQLMFYPAQRRPDRTIHLLPGALNPVAMFFWGDAAAVADPHLIIETPPTVAIAGPVVAGRFPFAEPFEAVAEPVERDGVALSRWRVPIQAESLAQYLKPDAPSWERYHFIYAQPGEGCPDEFVWRWRLESAGEVGPLHELPARLVAREDGSLAPVPDFRLFTQHSDALRRPTPEGRARVLDYLQYAGIGGGLAVSYYGLDYKPVDQELEAAGYFTWTWSWHGYGGAMEPGQEIVYAEDAPRKRKLVCPQVQAERQEPFWSWLVERYAAALERERPWIIMNFEPPWSSQVCFCERCRRAFAKFADLDETEVLAMTTDEIRKLPDDPWGLFRVHQNDLIIEAHVDAARQTDPDIKFGVCGPPWTEWHAAHGMDISLFEPEVFLHAPMIYRPPAEYGDLVHSTCENTSALVMPFLLASDVAVPGVFPSAADVQLNMLATALSGGDGAVLWVGIESLDGEIMNALRRSMNEIRELQRYITGGERLTDLATEIEPGAVRQVVIGERTIEMPSENALAPVMVWGWRSERGHLEAAINYDEEAPHSIRLTAPGIASARSLYGAAPAVDGDAVVIAVAPGEFTALAW